MWNRRNIRLKSVTMFLSLLLCSFDSYALFGPNNYKECELEAFKSSKTNDMLAIAMEACRLEFKQGVKVNSMLGPKNREECKLQAFKKSKTIDSVGIAIQACNLEFKEFQPDAYEKGTCALSWNGANYVGGSKLDNPNYRPYSFDAPSGISPRLYISDELANNLGLSRVEEYSNKWNLILVNHFNEHFSSIEPMCKRIIDEYRQ